MKIALTMTDAYSTLLFRKGLIIALVELGHEVCVISAPGDSITKLERLGVRHISIDLDRFINPLSDLRLIFRFYRIFKKENFDIVHNFTIKPNTFGTITAYLAGCKRIFNSVTGLGFMFYEPEEKNFVSKTIKAGIKYLFKISSRLAEKTWFQNPDDAGFFIENQIIKSEKAVLVKGSGVNLDEWKLPEKETIATLKEEAGFQPEDILVAMVARALNSKGIHEFLFAMEKLTPLHPRAKFVLAGGAEENLNKGVSASFLKEKAARHPFFWLGHLKKVIDIFAISDIIVLPSYYGEGVPRCLLEAMALKKPVITTDHRGCREAVDDGVNGFLVPVRDKEAVADRTEILVKNSELRNKMGNAGFEKAAREFDEALIVKSLLKNLYQLKETSQ